MKKGEPVADEKHKMRIKNKLEEVNDILHEILRELDVDWWNLYTEEEGAIIISELNTAKKAIERVLAY